MPLDRELLRQYLQQRVELGDRELFLDTMTAAQFREALERGGLAANVIDKPATFAPSTDVREQTDDQRRGKLTILQKQAEACIACALHAQRRQAVFARGNPFSELMVVGEAPGEEEDKTGLPFVGRAGKLLDVLLASIGFPRDSAYICNVLKCRPPGNRNPLPIEIAACSGFLRQQIEIIAPKALLAVGKFAAQTLLKSEESIGRLRGQVHHYNGLSLVVTYHPAYLLRTSSATRTAWYDFQLLRQVIDEQT